MRQLELLPWTAQRRDDLLMLHDQLDAHLAPLDQALSVQAAQQAAMRRLMTHPGVGPVVASAFVLTVGEPTRFARSKQVVSYRGLAPSEHSSGGRQKLGHVSKQGNSLLRWLLVEAAHTAARYDAEWKRQLVRLAFKKSRQVAVVAIARKLAVRWWWMWKLGLDYPAIVGSGSHAE